MYDITAEGMPPDFPQHKAALMERIQHSRSTLEQLIASLSTEQLTTLRDAGGWAIKDHLAHLAAWERSVIALLNGQPRHTGLAVAEEVYLTRDLDRVNDQIYQQHKDRPLEEVLADFAATHQQLHATLDGLSDADLFKPYAAYLPSEPGVPSTYPVIRWVAGNSYQHYDEHQNWIRGLLGETGA